MLTLMKSCRNLANKKRFQEIHLETFDFVGGPTWARTKDHLIMSQVL